MTFPSDDQSVDITALLAAWRAGDQSARDRAIECLYPTMLQQARARLHGVGKAKLGLDTTELAHEAFLRLNQQHSGFQNRAHFLAISAQTLKRILTDLLRATLAEKRDAEVLSIHLIDPDAVPESNSSIALAELMQSLEVLEKRDAIAAQVIELRFFGGLSAADAAEVMNLGVATVNRHFAFARAWLLRRQA
jgi:RNA polymerase sigma factor (TIGR02999 family)